MIFGPKFYNKQKRVFPDKLMGNENICIWAVYKLERCLFETVLGCKNSSCICIGDATKT